MQRYCVRLSVLFENANGRFKWLKTPGLRNEGIPKEHISADGSKHWYLNGNLHREDGPAVELMIGTRIGTRAWYINDRLHREDGPAIEHADGTKAWYINGDLHREDGPAIERSNGDKEWWLNGNLHREDGPAIEWADGKIEYWINGQEYEMGIGGRLVRKISTESVENGSISLIEDKEIPKATVDTWGTVSYHLSNGDLHREDGPAIEYANGAKKWYLNGKIHREGGPAIQWKDGCKWVFNGRIHREGGPAIEWRDGTKEWWFNGNLHREDGPAIEYPNGSKEWYFNGKRHRRDGPAVERVDGGEEEYWIDGEEYELGIGGRLVRKISTESVESNTYPHVLFEHTPVPWKAEGIGGREVDDSVDLFSGTLEAATLKEAEERAQHMFEAIRGKEIQVRSMYAFNANGDYFYLHEGPYTVIPHSINGVFNEFGKWYDFTIDCKIPKAIQGSNPQLKGITSAWVSAPSIRVTNP